MQDSFWLDDLMETISSGFEGLGGMFGQGSMLGGQSASIPQLENFNPQQLQQLMTLLNSSMNQYQNPTQGFEPIQQRAMSQFNQQVVPGLAERFAGLGSNQISSPAFTSQLAGAGTDLQERLAAMESQYGLKNQANALQGLQLGFKSPYTYAPRTEAQPGMLEKILPMLAEIGVRAGGAYATGGASEFLPAIGQAIGGFYKSRSGAKYKSRSGAK